MKLKEIRSQMEKGRTVLLAVPNPSQDTVMVLLHNPYNKDNIRAEFSIFEYTVSEQGWTVSIDPNYSEFEHIEQGLEYINRKFEKFLPR